MKKVTIAAMAIMVLASGVMAADVNVNDYVKNDTFDTKGYFKAKSSDKNKNKFSEPELLLQLIMMKEALKDAATWDEADSMDVAVARSVCGGVAQRLNSEYGSFENMNISQQEIKAGVVNMRQSWGHLCWASARQYRYDGWREYNFEKAMWGQAYAMAVTEKLVTNKIKELILEGERLDPNYAKKRPLYNSLKILSPLVDPRPNLERRIIAGYVVNSTEDVAENLFENVVSAAMHNGEPWRITQFVMRPRDFIAAEKKNQSVVKYYNYMSEKIKDQDLFLKNITIAQAKAEEEKRIAQAKAEEEKRIAQAKAEEEYLLNLPALKNEILNLRKHATKLICPIGAVQFNDVKLFADYKTTKIADGVIVDIEGVDYVGYLNNGQYLGEYTNPVSSCLSGEENAELTQIVITYFKENRAQYDAERAKFEKRHPRWGVKELGRGQGILEVGTMEELREKFEDRLKELSK